MRWRNGLISKSAWHIICLQKDAMTDPNAYIELLSSRPNAAEMILAPGSKPVLREFGMTSLIGATTLAPADVQSILETLQSFATSLPHSLGQSGVFYFGLAGKGRFRVAYVTQRGSYAACLSRIPQTIWPVTELVEDEEEAAGCTRELLSFGGGLLVITGPNDMLSNTFAYSLLGLLNDERKCIMYTLESFLTHVLNHRSAVVLQSELGADTPTLRDGILSGLAMDPDVFYMRDVSSEEDLRLIVKAAKSTVLKIITVASYDLETLFPGGKLPLDERHFHGYWHVDQSSPGRVRLNMMR